MHPYRTAPPPLILLGPSWPVHEWLGGGDGPNRAARHAFVHLVVLADLDAAAKLDAADQYRDRWGHAELRRALRLAAWSAGGLDRTGRELLRRLTRREVAAA